MSGQRLATLHITGVRYRGSRPAQGDERALDAYTRANVYGRAVIPISYHEVVFPEHLRSAMETDNLGLIGGAIAESIAAACQAGAGAVLTGGDCTHSTGVLGGLQAAFGPSARIGMVWFDAHGDCNTPKTTRSGMLGGMPVAVCAGLAHPGWRERSHIVAPLPTDRILMVDVRNLDPEEEQLIRATDITIAAAAAGFPGADLERSVADLAARCDLLYLHIDSDILDASLVPNHGTREPNGPSMAQVLSAIETVMASGKVAALAVVSVYGEGDGSAISVNSGIELIGSALKAWRQYGLPG
ncbi:MAG TPA: arginase family protein [Roseiflexaceae bacterium]|nr:arginase family protein [Roseiflexaceae bacterium]